MFVVTGFVNVISLFPIAEVNSLLELFVSVTPILSLSSETGDSNSAMTEAVFSNEMPLKLLSRPRKRVNWSPPRVVVDTESWLELSV